MVLNILNLKRGEKLTSGGFGSIHLTDSCMDIVIKTQVNIKELDILVKLKGHPYIAKIVGINESSFSCEQIEIIMEKADMDGVKFIHSYHDISTRKRAILNIMLGLEYIHSKNIVHCDLKPDNLLWFESCSRVKISDFGISRQFTTQKDFKLNASTDYYRAPELEINDTVMFSQDIWSIGAILFEFIYKGRFYDVFNNNRRNICSGKLHKLLFSTTSSVKIFERDFMGKCVDFCDLLSKMLNIDPKKRINISDAVDHNFFKPYKLIINEMRKLYPPVPFDIQRISIIDDDKRRTAIKYLMEARCDNTDRVVFQALSIYDRCRASGLNKEHLMSSCIEISKNYFSESFFTLDEEIMKTLSFDIYKSTLYESSEEQTETLFNIWITATLE